MKFTWLKWSALPAAVLLAGSVAMAQDQTSSQSQSGSSAPAAAPAATPAPATKPTVAQRKENQQDRIAQGVKSGQLTAGETSKLETKEAAINGETKADRAANGGKLTSAEKTQINGQQNQLSKQIYADKHNANTANPGNSKVGQRQIGQQVAKFLFDHVADHALGLRPEYIERIRLVRFVRRTLQRQQPDLRTVAVCDHDLVARIDLRQRLGRNARVGTLHLGCHRLAPP
jgi:hypothetical protein